DRNEAGHLSLHDALPIWKTWTSQLRFPQELHEFGSDSRGVVGPQRPFLERAVFGCPRVLNDRVFNADTEASFFVRRLHRKRSQRSEEHTSELQQRSQFEC